MIKFLSKNRTSARVAFVLRLLTTVAGALMGLFWSLYLVKAMGNKLYGDFLTFGGVTRLGGLGDLGMGGAVALRSGQLLGEGNETKLKNFLANARAVFLALGGVAFFLFLILSPWLPRWLKFETSPGSGSMTFLFATGAASIGLLIVSGYFQNLNYAHRNIVWPILPSLVLAQLSFLGQWLLARAHAPLWAQNLPYVTSALIFLILSKAMLDWSHGFLGNLRPLRFDKSEWKFLLTSSGWVYLCSLGHVIYVTTDRFVLKAGIGSEIIPAYQFNYRPCDIAVTIVLTAAFVGVPKITQLLSSLVPENRRRAIFEIHRLNQFQTFLGSTAAMVYLLFNNIFIRYWFGAEYLMPLELQIAFALNLAITASGDTSIQIAGRCGRNGIRAGGIAIACTGILNLALSILAVKFHSFVGVAVATVIAQSALSLILGWYVCRYLGISLRIWISKTWLLPLATLLTAGALRLWLPKENFLHIGTLLLCYGALMFFVCKAAGINLQLLRAEWEVMRAIIKQRST